MNLCKKANKVIVKLFRTVRLSLTKAIYKLAASRKKIIDNNFKSYFVTQKCKGSRCVTHRVSFDRIVFDRVNFLLSRNVAVNRQAVRPPAAALRQLLCRCRCVARIQGNETRRRWRRRRRRRSPPGPVRLAPRAGRPCAERGPPCAVTCPPAPSVTVSCRVVPCPIGTLRAPSHAFEHVPSYTVARSQVSYHALN